MTYKDYYLILLVVFEGSIYLVVEEQQRCEIGSHLSLFLPCKRGIAMDKEAKKFLANVEGGNVPVTCHDDVLRIAYIYNDEMGLCVFDIVEKLHAHDWSFGEGSLRFNR